MSPKKTNKHDSGERASRRWIEKPLYTAGISLYRFGVRTASMGNRKARLLNAGQRDTATRLSEAIGPDDKVVWVHAASLGEFEQGRPLMERIRMQYPGFKILLTFFSPSGFEVRKNWDGADCVCYLPFDTPGRVRRFLDAAHPDVAVFVKYEIWRNYLQELSRRQIPAFLISAVFRKDQFFFRHPESWYASWLQWYSHIFVQDEGSKLLLDGIGQREVTVCGDTRFDRVSEIKSTRKPIPELEAFTRKGSQNRPLTVMTGSSWPEDEDIYAGWFHSHPEIKLVIAPHEFDCQRLSKLLKRFGGKAVLMGEIEDNPEKAAEAEVLIMDCFGLLSSAYAYCDVAYIGGGFGAGLHNINEAAVYGVPVIYGPNNKKFIEARELAKCGGGFEVSSASEFGAVMDNLTCNPSARKEAGTKAEAYIRTKLGATDKILSHLRPILDGKSMQ